MVKAPKTNARGRAAGHDLEAAGAAAYSAPRRAHLGSAHEKRSGRKGVTSRDGCCPPISSAISTPVPAASPMPAPS